MSLRRVVHGVVLLCMAAWLTVSAAASEYRGQVTFSGLPLPGSTVTVTATQGDKKAVAVSDDQGVFAFPDLADGTWTLTIEMTGFAPLKQQVTIAPNVQAATFELKLLSLDQIRAEDKPVKVDTTLLASTQPASSTAGGPQVAGANPAAAPSAASQKASDGVLINGSQSNAATSQFSMNQAFGNTRSHRSLYNGNVLLTLDNSALDAAPYNIAGTPEPRPQFNNYSLGFTVGGPLNIPHLMPRGPYFQLSYSHSQSSDYQTLNELVPTGEQADKSWQLSSGPIYVPANLAAVAPMCSSYLAANPNSTGPDPSTPSTGKLVFKNNVIPASCVTPASTVLLNQYPAANVTGNSVYNYQIPQNNSTVSDSFSISLQKQLGNKNNLSGRFNYQNSRGNNINPNIFSFLDTNATLGMNVSVAWRHTISQRFYSSMTYSFGRLRTQVLPSFSNIETQAGISGAIPSNAYNGQYQGPPKLNFSSSIAGFNDSVLSNNRNENNTLKEDLNWYHGHHTIQFGGVFSRLEFNYLTETNPNGTLGFTGAATQATIPPTSGTGTATSTVGGSDLADFLLGIPDTSAIAYGNADKYLRQSTYALYVNDDFRVNPELSLNAGLRWEYGSPVSELKGRLVNLNVGQDFSSAIPVTGTNPLLRPDYSRPEPNISLSWRPISGSSLLIKSAYQMANDTSVYQQAAYEMAQQAPLSTSLSLQNGVGCQLTITSPFPSTGCGTTPATFAIDPNFRVGYVQVWNLQLQRDLPFSMQMVADYDGTKGTHGVQELLPNTCPPGVTCNGNHGYIYRTSNGNLEREAGWIQLRRRPRNGFEASVIYTFAKSLDDYYSLGGQGSVTNTSALAQDWTNLRGQRGLSTTDQRHLVNVVAQYTTGMGIGGKALLSGWRGAIYKDWSIKTVFSAGSGLPETPIYGAATASGTGFSGTIRPDVVGSPYANLTSGRFLNPNAYAAPAAGYGNARRDSIEGPHTFSLNANMLRTFRLRGRRSLNAQISATNVLNHVVFTQWNTVWIPASTSGSSTASTPNSSFGAPELPNGMRSVSLSLRMEF